MNLIAFLHAALLLLDDRTPSQRVQSSSIDRPCRLWATTEDAAVEKGPSTSPKRERPRIPILLYQDDVLCVNKPAGISVHRSRHTGGAYTLQSLLKRQLSRKVYSVHRLDHRTSGAIWFGFTSEAAADLHTRLRASKKTYVALLRGVWNYETDSHTVDEPLRIQDDQGRVVYQDACTTFTRLASGGGSPPTDAVPYPPDRWTLVLAHPQTGRTHQIRRHARSGLAMPLIGDSQHGDSVVNRWWRQNRGLNRLALHCLGMEGNLDVVAPLTDDLKRVLESLEGWHEAVELEPRLITAFYDERGGTKGIFKDWQKQRHISDS